MTDPGRMKCFRCQVGMSRSDVVPRPMNSGTVVKSMAVVVATMPRA